ncbi:FecR family protein [Treponema pedis]|uniref:FecR family protein n=1 Tax=Treponema pedis TaxID=409322 RepID=UPI003133EE1E
MKKLILAAVFIFCFFIPLSAVSAEIIAVKGKAEIKQNGVWVAAKQGDVVSAGNTISTAFKSELTLRIDGSTVIVQPLTRLTVEEIAAKAETVSSKVYLNVGSVKADIKPASTKKVEFKVRTPVATASVRGTSGRIYSDGTLEGFSGKWLYYTDSGTTVFVAPGNSVSIDDKGTVIPPQTAKIISAGENAITTLADREKKGNSLSSVNNDIDVSELSPIQETITISISWED